MPHTSNRPVDWAKLVTENENRLYRTALAILGHPQEAEDAVQDAFVKYLEKAPKNLENPPAWLMRVLVNGCKSRLRLQWRQVTELPDAPPARRNGRSWKNFGPCQPRSAPPSTFSITKVIPPTRSPK